MDRLLVLGPVKREIIGPTGENDLGLGDNDGPMHCTAMELLASIAVAEVRSLRLISVDLERHIVAMTASRKEGFLRFKRLVCYIWRLLLPVL